MSTTAEERRYRDGDEPVPGFRLDQFLGAGAFGEVWKAVSAGGVDVAMKILYRIDRKAGRKAFRALQLVKNVNNPHLVPIQAFWLKDEHGNILDDDIGPEFATESSSMDVTTPERGDLRETLDPSMDEADEIRETPSLSSRPAELIIAMGLADETLFDCMERHQSQGKMGIPFKELIGYMEGAAKGLDYLNIEHNIQHGDIKPQNMMINGGEGMVSDFDLAKNLGDPRSTTTKAFTVAYVPPEVYTTGNPSPTSDQYAFAVSYCELRSGKLPYVAETVAAVIAAKTAGKLDLAELPKTERKVIKKATSPDPAKRYRTSVAVVRALRGEPTHHWAWFLKRAAAFLAVLAVGLGVWALPVWQPNDLMSCIKRIVGTGINEEEVVAELQNLATKPEVARDYSDVAIGTVLGNVKKLVDGAQDRDWSDLKEWTEPVLDLLMKRASDHLDRTPALAAICYQPVDSFFEGDNTVTLVNNPDLWLARARLGLTRASMLQGEWPDTHERLDSLSSMERVLDNRREEDAEREWAGLLAVKCLAAANRPDPDLLSSDVLKPLATLLDSDSNNGLLNALTRDERNDVEKLAEKVDREYSASFEDKFKGESFSEDQIGWLSVITGGDSELHALLHEAKKSYVIASETGVLREFRDTMSRLPESDDAASGSDRRSTIQRRIAELRVLLTLIDPNESAGDLLRSQGDSPARFQSTFENRVDSSVSDFFDTLLWRAEQEVLGEWTNLAPNQLLDLAEIQSCIDQSSAALGESGPTLRARLAGIQVIDAIYRETPAYAELGDLCAAFQGAALPEVPEIIRQLVGVCGAECKVIQHIQDDESPLSDQELELLRSALPSIQDGPDKFRDYGLFGSAIGNFHDTSEQDVAQTAHQLISDLQTEQIIHVLLARGQRTNLVAGIMLRAASTEQTGNRPNGFLDSPFRAGGADVAYKFLNYVHDTLGKTNDAEVNRLLALAAYFCEPPHYDKVVAISTKVTSGQELDPAQLPIMLLISARASQLREKTDLSENDKDLAAAMHSYGRLADLYSTDKAWVMTHAEFYQLVVGKAHEFLNQSTQWLAMLERLKQDKESKQELDEWQQLDESDRALRQDIAKIYAGWARILRDIAGIDVTVKESDQRVFELFELASIIDPSKVDYLMQKVAAFSKLQSTTDELLRTLKETIEKVEIIDAEHIGKVILRGRVQMLEARLTTDSQKQRELLEGAIEDFKKAEGVGGENHVMRLVGKADAHVQLANAYAAHDKDQHIAQIKKLLEGAEESAKEAVDLRFVVCRRDFIYLVWGNALEDQEMLLKIPGKYKKAIEKFKSAEARANSDGHYLDAAAARLSLGRCMYRLSLDTGEDHLEEALEILKSDEEKIEDGILQVENSLYQARINRLLAARSRSTRDRVEKFLEADRCYANVLERAQEARIPRQTLWRLERAYNARNLWHLSDDEEDRKMWAGNAVAWVVGILDTFHTGAQLSQTNSEMALACIKILMRLPNSADISSLVDQTLPSLANADFQIHLLLLRTQYLCDECPSKQAWHVAKKMVARDLTHASRMADGPTPNARVSEIWKARILGQTALVEKKDFDWPTDADERREKGLVASNKLRDAIASFGDCNDRRASSDAVTICFILGTLNQVLLTERGAAEKLDAPTWNGLKDSAVAALNQITPDAWKERQADWNSGQVGKIDWDWGREGWGVLFDGEGAPIDDKASKRIADDINALVR